MAYVGLDKFYADAAAGTLPRVSYIIGPAELSEHPPYQPRDGAWLQRKVVEAVVNGKNYKNTALIISYDGKQDLNVRLHLLTSLIRIWRLGRPRRTLPLTQRHSRRMDRGSLQ